MKEAAERGTVTPEEMHRSTAQVGEPVHRTTISHVLHKYVIMKAWQEKKKTF